MATGSRALQSYSKKTRTAQCLALDIGQLTRAGLIVYGQLSGTVEWSGRSTLRVALHLWGRRFNESVLRLSYGLSDRDEEQVIDDIRLKTTRPYFGGLRWWFSCPGCGRRVRILYLRPDGEWFRCRHCHELAYRSQLQGRLARAMAKSVRIRRRLGGSPGPVGPFSAKPKGMHEHTHLRWGRKAKEAEREVVTLLEARLSQTRGHLKGTD